MGMARSSAERARWVSRKPRGAWAGASCACPGTSLAVRLGSSTGHPLCQLVPSSPGGTAPAHQGPIRSPVPCCFAPNPERSLLHAHRLDLRTRGYPAVPSSFLPRSNHLPVRVSLFQGQSSRSRAPHWIHVPAPCSAASHSPAPRVPGK